MADIKSSTPTPADELIAARVALKDADASVQRLHRLTETAHFAIKAMLMQPDSIAMRTSILDLLERLEGEAFTAMNDINTIAEQFQADFIDNEWHSDHGAVCAAVRAQSHSVQ